MDALGELKMHLFQFIHGYFLSPQGAGMGVTEITCVINVKGGCGGGTALELRL